MTLIISIGPHVLGKMIIDQKLEKLPGFKLFHNRMTIEIVAQFFSYSTPAGRELVNRIRQEFFNAFCVSDAAGYIFTCVWAFSEASEREYIEGINNQLRKTDIKRTG